MIFCVVAHAYGSAERVGDCGGSEESIIGFLIHLLNKNGKNIPSIRFDYVGKTSPAHKAALDVFRGKKEADLVVSAKEVLRLAYERK